MEKRNNFRQEVLENISLGWEEFKTVIFCFQMVILLFLFWALCMIGYMVLGLAYIIETPFALAIGLIRNKNSFIVIPFLRRVRIDSWFEKIPIFY